MIDFGAAMIVLNVSVLLGPSASPRQTPAPPASRREDMKETLHGVEVADPYRWLEDQQSPETRAWIDAQNAYTQSLLGKLPVRNRLAKRLDSLLRVETIQPPTERNGWYYYWKKRPEDDLAIYYRRKGLKGPEEIIIDPHPLSSDHTTNVAIMGLSEDGKLLAYGIRHGGEDEVEVRIMETETRKDFPDRLPKALYSSFSFTRDASAFYYGLRDAKTGTRIKRHALGSPVDSDSALFGEGIGPESWIGASVSGNGKWLLITVSHGWSRSDIYVQDLVGGGPIVPVIKDIDADFTASFAGDSLVVQTDWKAPKRRILRIDPKKPEVSNWREIVPEGVDSIESYSLAGERVYVHSLHNVTSRITAYDLEGASHGEVELPGLGTASAPGGRWEKREAFFTFASFSTPNRIYRLDTRNGKTSIWARQKTPVKTDRIVVRQEWFASKDGTKVPMFLVHKKDLKLDGQRPVFLTGYGGFNVSNQPYFSNFAALVAEHDGVFALPNLRGGGEFGEAWHKDGMLAKKQNVFDDFIAAAEWLIAKGYTNPKKLAISGGSNGGLLVGAALTQRPELFGSVICSVPLLDMVRYHKFLMAPLWVPEYGSADNPDQFKFLISYSPYHRVKPGTAYPATLFVTGDADTRVAPLHARKMTALLQAASSSGKPVLLHYDTKAGHAGAKPLSKIVEDLSLELAFLFQQWGIE